MSFPRPHWCPRGGADSVIAPCVSLLIITYMLNLVLTCGAHFFIWLPATVSIKTAMRHQVILEFITSCKCIEVVFNRERAPRHRTSSSLGSLITACYKFVYVYGPINMQSNDSELASR